METEVASIVKVEGGSGGSGGSGESGKERPVTTAAIERTETSFFLFSLERFLLHLRSYIFIMKITCKNSQEKDIKMIKSYLITIMRCVVIETGNSSRL